MSTTTTTRTFQDDKCIEEVVTVESLNDRAEKEKALAEAEAAKATARKTIADAEYAELTLERERRKEKSELAKDQHHHVYLFDESVGAASVKKCITTLSEWDRLDPHCDIEIVFDSPGGSVIDGMHLWDFLSMIKSRGHKLTTVALGMAASMAGILLQAGDVRVLGKESYLLIHEVSFGAGGKIGEVEDEVAFVKKIQGRVLDIFAARSKMSRSAIASKWRRRDWWLDSSEALKHGFVDELR